MASFIGEDDSGSFGILAGHARMMTMLGFGLARFRAGGRRLGVSGAAGCAGLFCQRATLPQYAALSARRRIMNASARYCARDDCKPKRRLSGDEAERASSGRRDVRRMWRMRRGRRHRRMSQAKDKRNAAGETGGSGRKASSAHETGRARPAVACCVSPPIWHVWG